MKKATAGVVTLLIALAGCAVGPKQLRDGHLAYNESVRTASDKELLLNIVRVRYLDTIEFLAINSISAQVEFTVGIGASAGREFGEDANSVTADAFWSSRPTFTFTPQRGSEFATMMMKPVPLPILIDLAAADWDVKVLLQLLVQNINGLPNLSGATSSEFIEVAELLRSLQDRAKLHFGTIEVTAEMSDPISATQVTGADLIAAAEKGYRLERHENGEVFVLSKREARPVIYVPEEVEEDDRLFQLLKLDLEDRDYIEIRSEVIANIDQGRTDHIAVDTRSVLDSLVYLSAGVEVPTAHLERGWTVADYPVPGVRSADLRRLFQVRSSERRPDAALAVRHRGTWFYLSDDDPVSRTTFLVVAELLRLALSPGDSRAPLLTLPVGGR